MPSLKPLKLLCLFLSLSPLNASAAVWDSRNAWNQDWENRYSEWVKSPAWHKNIFTDRNSPYFGIRTDCADTVYTMRAIFAFENKLPFAIKDPSGGQRLITNEMSRFDQEASGTPRLKAFLRFLFNIVDTQGLPRDTYPIALTRESVRPGTLILEKEKKHSFTIKEIRHTGTPHLIYSTQKNNGPLLVRESYPSISWLFPQGVKEPSGIRAFRPIEHLHKNVWEVPGYSKEQYEIPLQSWTKTVTEKLSSVKESAEEEIRRISNDACTMARFRIGLVNEAINFQKRNNRCMNAQEFDDMSTPSRDGQLKEAFKELEAAYHKGKNQISRELRDQMDRFMVENESLETPQISDLCALQIASNKTLSLGEFKRRLLAGKISSNPNDAFENRWGEGNKKAKACPVY